MGLGILIVSCVFLAAYLWASARASVPVKDLPAPGERIISLEEALELWEGADKGRRDVREVLDEKRASYTAAEFPNRPWSATPLTHSR